MLADDCVGEVGGRVGYWLLAIGYWILVVGIYPVAFYAVDSKSLIAKADAVAVVEGDAMCELNADGIVSGGNDLANHFASGFWGLPVCHISCAGM